MGRGILCPFTPYMFYKTFILFNVMGSDELNEIADITSDSIERQKINYNKSKIIRIISKDVADEELNNHEWFN